MSNKNKRTTHTGKITKQQIKRVEPLGLGDFTDGMDKEYTTTSQTSTYIIARIVACYEIVTLKYEWSFLSDGRIKPQLLRRITTTGKDQTTYRKNWTRNTGYRYCFSYLNH